MSFTGFKGFLKGFQESTTVLISPQGLSLCLLGIHWVFECDPRLHREFVGGP